MATVENGDVQRIIGKLDANADEHRRQLGRLFEVTERTCENMAVLASIVRRVDEHGCAAFQEHFEQMSKRDQKLHEHETRLEAAERLVKASGRAVGNGAGLSATPTRRQYATAGGIGAGGVALAWILREVITPILAIWKGGGGTSP